MISKWIFLFITIATWVSALSSKQVRQLIWQFICKFYLQIIITVALFTALLVFAEMGT